MKFKRIPIRSTPSGNEVSIPTYFFEGKDPEAKSAYLQASVHGAELQGNAVIFHLIEFFKKHPPLGDVTLVPCANPCGMDRKTGEYTDGRFDPTTGDNWNRAYFMPVIRSESLREDPAQLCIESLPAGLSRQDLKDRMTKAIREKKKHSHKFAQKLALTLQELASKADLVLDLHNANRSLPYLYAEETTLDDALFMGISSIISIPPHFGGALDEAISAPWSILHQKYAWPPHAIPQSYTLELGEQEVVSLSQGEIQAAGIIEFFKHQGVISGKPKKPKPAVVGKLSDYRTIYAKRGGLYEYQLTLGQAVPQGRTLAHCLTFDSSGGVREEVKTDSKFFPILHYSSSAVNEGDELFKGFVEWKKMTCKKF